MTTVKNVSSVLNVHRIMNATVRNAVIVCMTGEKVPTAKDALSVLNV